MATDSCKKIYILKSIPNKYLKVKKYLFKPLRAINLSIIAFLLSGVTAFSQQMPVLTFGFENPMLYNPASTVFKNSMNATLQYRQQWVGVPGAPETFVFSVDGKPSKNMGIGLAAYNDQTDIIGQLGIAGSYAYKFNFLSNHSLSLGLSAMIIRNQINYDKINANQPNETILFNYPQRASNFDAGIGFRYMYKDFLFVDFSAINLLKSKYSYEDQSLFKDNRFQLMTHYFISAGYTYKIQEGKYKVEPWIGLRSAQGLPLQYEGNVSFTWNDILKFTSGYRQDAGGYAALQVKIFESITIGYAHDFSNKYIRSISNGTNELYLSFKIFGRVPTTKDNINAKELKIIKKQSQEQYQEIERLQQENERLVKQQALNDSLVKNQKVEIDRLKEIFNKDKDAVDKVKEKYIIKEADIDSAVAVDNKERVKSIYVIVGAYLKLADAKLFQKILEREIGLETLIFEREDGQFYFVYTRQVKSQNEAEREYKRLKRLKVDTYINGNVWLYGEK